MFEWTFVGDVSVNKYDKLSGELLKNIVLPCNMLRSTEQKCTSHVTHTDKLYRGSVQCLITSVSQTISSKIGSSFKQMPGSNDPVQDWHELAGMSYKTWVLYDTLRYSHVHYHVQM